MTRTTLAAGLLTALACLTVHAQTLDFSANIPFDFHIGAAVMPAGEYAIHESGPVLALRTMTGERRFATVLVLHAIRPDRDAAGKLIFHRYGNAYFLSKVWAPDSPNGRELRPTLMEKEYLSRAAVVEVAGVRLRRK